MLSTGDLLVLTSLDQLLFLVKILFPFFVKQATLIRPIVLSFPPQLVFPGVYCSQGTLTETEGSVLQLTYLLRLPVL